MTPHRPDDGDRPAVARGEATFTPPTSGPGQDWVLALDRAGNQPAPG